MDDQTFLDRIVWPSKTVLFFSIIISILISIPLLPPSPFPTSTIVTIPPETSVLGAGEILKTAGVIRSSALFRAVNHFDTVHAGTYLFERPQHMLIVASRLRTSSYGLSPVKITFPEGETVREMAKRVTETFPHISQEDFINEAKQYEGYLFPDTYLFIPFTDIQSIIKTTRKTFVEKTNSLQDGVPENQSFNNVVIMASILEKEARTQEVRRVISGILWKRLEIGMPLQVDAVFGYIFNRDTFSPSFADLKVESPYNTYLHRGLPPGPISNPGLDSLTAALHPETTDYLYYLTGNDGKMYYATTYAEHQRNERAHLR
jgi:UPF0755 protein